MDDSGRQVFEESPVRANRENVYLRLQSVTIFVRDLDRSVEFYVDTLGFPLVFDGRNRPSRGFAVVAPPDGTANLVLSAPEPSSETYKLIGRNTQITFITEDLLAKFREWRRRGVVFLVAPRLRRLKHRVVVQAGQAGDARASGGAAPIWGGAFARFKDPDGNSFGLVSFDEVTREVEAQRRAVAEKEEAERRVAQELEIAKQVQARFFPQSRPSLQSLEFAGCCIPARHVGGDYYDYLHFGPQRIGLVIGDVSGKGIAAALLMANLQANLRSQCAISIDQPLHLLHSVNQLFCENTAEAAFATLFFAEYDDESRRLRYINCGHLPPLLLHADESLEKLGATATVMGAFREWECELAECQLCPGDTLLLYTDGVTESFSPLGEEFGEERLRETLRRNREQCCEAVVSSILEEVQKFSPHEQHDDITLIVAKCIAGTL